MGAVPTSSTTGLVAGAFAFPLGWISLRTQRHTFIVISIAWVFIFQLLAYNLQGIHRWFKWSIYAFNSLGSTIC